MRKFIFILLLSILIGIVFYLLDDKDFCLDTGVCKENTIINTEFGEILINKKNCLQHNWQWDEKGKYCKIYNDNDSELKNSKFMRDLLPNYKK